MAEELLIISFGKAKFGLSFAHSHLLLAFPDATVFFVNLSFLCFLFLLSFLLSATQLRHPSSNEVNEGLVNIKQVGFNGDLHHYCCLSLSSRALLEEIYELDNSLETCMNLTVKGTTSYLISTTMLLCRNCSVLNLFSFYYNSGNMEMVILHF